MPFVSEGVWSYYRRTTRISLSLLSGKPVIGRRRIDHNLSAFALRHGPAACLAG
jgi:hypothetical protein